MNPFALLVPIITAGAQYAMSKLRGDDEDEAQGPQKPKPQFLPQPSPAIDYARNAPMQTQSHLQPIRMQALEAMRAKGSLSGLRGGGNPYMV